MSIIERFQNSDKHTQYSVYTVILFSFMVLSAVSIYHVSGDGCWHIPAGKFIAENQRFPLFEPLGRDEPFWSPPLYHIFVAVVYFIFNSFNHDAANFAVKFVSPIFGILALIFSFLVIKKLTNPKIAFYSIIFLAFIPIFMDYSMLSYVESMLVFFVVLSVYFLINERYMLSGIAAGLAILTKYNGLFILPVLLYILYRKFGNKKLFYKKSLIVAALALIVPLPWLIRNWILLGNPIWPFLNFVFHGYAAKSYSALNLKNLVSQNLPLSAYFGIFGVPDGNYHLLSILDPSRLKVFLPIWLFGTFLFLIPLFIGFFNKKAEKRDIFFLWISIYFILFLMYIANVGFGVSRIILPAFPAVSVFWAFGFERLMGNVKTEKIFRLVIALVIAGFIFTFYAKTYIASNSWGIYRGDFDWIRQNTDQGDLFLASGQCVPYNIERTSLYFSAENLDKSDYIWVNQDFWLDRRSVYNEDELKTIQSKNAKLVYSNKETGTEIYRIKQ